MPVERDNGFDIPDRVAGIVLRIDRLPLELLLSGRRAAVGGPAVGLHTWRSIGRCVPCRRRRLVEGVLMDSMAMVAPRPISRIGLRQRWAAGLDPSLMCRNSPTA